jgi:glyoxylase-like metal-dependent hydrolase (beta-lactamase superfamily II)
MKATALNRRVTAWKGIPVERTVAMSFGLAALLGAIGGVVFTPLISTRFDIGLAIAAPGHTPRHTAFVVGSDREQLMVLSDTARMLTPCLRRSVRETDSSDSNDSSSQS